MKLFNNVHLLTKLLLSETVFNVNRACIYNAAVLSTVYSQKNSVET